MVKIIFTYFEDVVVTLKYEDDILVQIDVPDIEDNGGLGNIYVGKVKNIVNNINAAFIEIEDNKMCYFSLEENTSPIFLNQKKDDVIKPGDEILVQVTKEEINDKACVVKSNINFNGKYVVITHGKTDIGISNKIKDEDERKRLKRIFKSLRNDRYGFILRTNAQGLDEKTIKAEVDELVELYNKTISKAYVAKCFKCVYKSIPFYIKNIRDINDEIEIITDIKDIYDEINEYGLCNDKVRVKYYQDSICSLNALYSVNSSINNALKEKVWLKSGGSIVIEQTEALVAIDVNTGKAIKGKSNMEKTFLKINLEAAMEIARQIRLRNLGGIIIVDFIDLSKQDNREYLVNEFSKLLAKDPIKTTLVDMTKLNLVEITRKKIRKTVIQQLNEKKKG